MTFKITKTAVRAKTRQLSAKWSLEPSSTKTEKRFEGSRPDQEYPVISAMRDWYLHKHGARVEVFKNDLAELSDWCQERCKKLWTFSYDAELTNIHDFIHRIQVAVTGERDSNYMEKLVSDSHARQIQREIDQELLGTLCIEEAIPTTYFWFEDRDEAMLFKLSFGGE